MKPMSKELEMYYNEAPIRDIAKVMGFCISKTQKVLRAEREELGLECRTNDKGERYMSLSEYQIARDAKLDKRFDEILALFKSGVSIGQQQVGRRFNTTYDVVFRVLVRKLGEDEAHNIEAIRNSNARYKTKIKEKKGNVMPKQSKSNSILRGAWI